MSNNTTNDEPPPIAERLGASLSYFCLATTCTVIYSIFIIAILRGRKKLKPHPFYVFVYHFAAADIGFIVYTNFLVSIPLSFAGKPLYGEGLLLHIISFGDSFFFRAVFFLVFLVSLNRFLIFFHPSLCEKLFERPNIYYTLIMPWTGGFILDILHILIGGCIKSFDHTAFHFYYDCTSTVSTVGEIERQLQTYFTVGLPLISLAMYLAAYVMLIQMRNVHSTNQLQSDLDEERNKRERSFLIQAFIICISLFIEVLLFNFVPWLASQNIINWYSVSLLLGWATILNSTINPLVYFIFNQPIRRAVLEFLGIKKDTTVQTQTALFKNSIDHLRSRRSSTVTVEVL